MITLGRYRVNPAFIAAHRKSGEASLVVYVSCPISASGTRSISMSCDSPDEREAIIEEIEAAVSQINGF